MEATEQYRLIQVGREALYESLHLSFDLSAIVASWFMAIQLRVLLNPFFSSQVEKIWATSWAPPLPGLLLLWIVAAAWQKLYQSDRLFSLATTVLQIVKSIIAVTTVMAFLTFFSRQFGIEFSRAFAFIFLPVSFVSLVLSLLLTRGVINRVGKTWPTNVRVAIVAQPDEADRILSSMREVAGADTPIRGLVLPDSELAGAVAEASMPILGNLSRLAEIVNREGLNRILVPSDGLTALEFAHCEQVSQRMGIPMSCPVRLARTDHTVAIKVRFGMHVLDFMPKRSRRMQEYLKRVLDLLVSASLLILLGPVLLCVSVLVKASSRGPVFYKAPRVGQGGRYFLFLKFRTMIHEQRPREELASKNEREGHLFKIRHDPRITPIGRVLRRYSIDELPQLINVLIGDMSLVGPRPLPAQDLDPDGMSRLFTEWAELRAQVRPGITGMWQIRGRSDLSFEEMVHLDLSYVEKWTVWTDLKILLSTPSAVLSGRGAY